MDKHLIVVRDRRKPDHFRIQNDVFKQWFPIIGTQGFSLYSLYVVMAGYDDEMARPGYDLLESFLGLSSATIAHYNRVLEWAGLVEIVRFELHPNKANRYYLLDEPDVTSERLYSIRQKAIEHYPTGNSYLQALLIRIDEWRPLDSYFVHLNLPTTTKALSSEKRNASVQNHSAFAEKPNAFVEKRSTFAEKRSAFAEKPNAFVGKPEQTDQKTVTTTNNKEEEQTTSNNSMAGWLDVSSIFEKLGISDPVLTTLSNKTDWSMAIAMAWWCITEDWSDNPAGLAIKRLQSGKFPPSGYFDLLEAIVAGDVTIDEVTTAAAMGKEFLADLGIGAGAVNAAAAIYKKDKEWFYLEV